MRLVLGFVIFNSFLSFPTFAMESAVSYPEFAAPIQEVSIEDLMPLKSQGINQGNTQGQSVISQQAIKFKNNIQKKVIMLGDHCSAVLVSDNGYAITALHCLETFYKLNVEKFVFANNVDLLASKSEGLILLSSLNRPEIVLAGKGYLHMKAAIDDKILNDAVTITKIRELNDDFVVIKLSKIPQDAKCAKISQKKPLENELLWSAGYPKYVKKVSTNPSTLVYEAAHVLERTSWGQPLVTAIKDLSNSIYERMPEEARRQYHDFMENPLYLSVGRAFNTYRNLQRSFTIPMDSALNRDALYPINRYFVSTTLSGARMSGGGTFNTNGELVGIMVAKATTHGKWYLQGLTPLTTHTRASYIVERIQADLGLNKFNEIFNCSND